MVEAECCLHSTVDLGEVTVWHVLGWLVADSKLETGRAPVNELNGALGLEGRNCAVSVLGDNVTTVQQASSHVFAVAWIALNHLVVGLEAGHGNLLNGVGLVGRFGGRDNWCIGDQREMDTWVGYQVGLEFVEIDVEGTIETERSGDG